MNNEGRSKKKIRSRRRRLTSISLLVKRFVLLLLALLVLYIGSYTWFRSTHIERWDRDRREYVIFPQSAALYYFYRPLAYIDARLTGVGFHIGPHRL
jgi:hypothetical protein